MTIAPPATAAQYQAAVLASGPAMFWPLGDPSPGPPREVVRGLVGTPVGALTYQVPDPWGTNHAMGFDGSTAYVYEETYDPPAGFVQPWSMETWLLSPAVASPGGGAVWWTVTPTPPLSGGSFGPGIYLGASNGFAVGFASQMNTVSINGTTNIADNRWHHVAFTFDTATGGTVALYVDGAQVARLTNNGTPQLLVPSYTSIGVAGNTNRGGYWHGSLCAYAYYNRTLSAAEVSRHFRSGVTGGFPGDGFPGDGFPGDGFPS